METKTAQTMEVDSYVSPYVKPSIRRYSCGHINKLKNEAMLNSYKLLHSFYVSCIEENSFHRKMYDCVCHVAFCQAKRNRVHACLSCQYFGCFNGHIQQHAGNKNHPLAMDTDSGQVYCTFCKDYKYHSDFITIEQKQNLTASCRRSLKTGKPYKWEPSPDEIRFLQCHEIVFHSKTDVTGFTNFNKITCYFSSIIQCLIHAPIFRDYLLSLKHLGNDKQERHPNCFICALSDVLQECFSGKRKSLILVELLFLLFKRTNTSLTQMQCAHECFLHLLDNFHSDVTRGDETQISEYFVSPCECIIHSIFEFKFRRQRTCHNINNPHINYLGEEKRWDISLNELPGSSHLLEVTFDDCLSRSLTDHIENYFCDECQKDVGCTIRSIPYKLPYIMNFCITYPETKGSRNAKKTAVLTFKHILDMSSYLSLPADSLECQYYLFAVVEFIKKHYKCYIRKSDQWFLCNDEQITPVDKESIIKVKPRILFYHRMYM